MKQRAFWLALMALLTISGLALAGCTSVLADNVATLNAAATAAAQGVDLPEEIPGANLLTPNSTNTPNLVDLTIDPNALLATAWGNIYALPGGEQFTLIATEDQAGQYVVDYLRLNGWQETVAGGSAALGSGQVRTDLALLVQNGDEQEFGSGTVTFQPTLDASGRLRLNPLGADFGALDIPGNLTSTIGDAVHAMLTGARDPSVSEVQLSQIVIENGIMQVTGVVR